MMKQLGVKIKKATKFGKFGGLKDQMVCLLIITCPKPSGTWKPEYVNTYDLNFNRLEAMLSLQLPTYV